MCGIFCCVGEYQGSENEFKVCTESLIPRGPESTTYMFHNKYRFGFTRLAINGLLKTGCSQPFSKNNLTWMCNGEIYNHKEIEGRYAFPVLEHGSDCEVIGYLYEEICQPRKNLANTSFQESLIEWARAFDGVFAIALYDPDSDRIILARDPYGVRPLYYAFHDKMLYAGSEIKAFPKEVTDIKAFPPGHVAFYNISCPDSSPFYSLQFVQYHSPPWIKNATISLTNVYETLGVSLINAVKKRLMTERPIAALLSGGLDSSLIAALVQRELKATNRPPLETYSIGFAGSSDLKYARLVADHIGSTHHEIISTPDEFFAAIPDVIRTIESPDITSVRASVGNWLVAKYIREHSPSQAKVVFNGDGSDEVFGSYLYFYNAPSDEAYEADVDRLLNNIHHFDVLRSDRSISDHGLEPRTPFLDKQFVAVARSIPTNLLRPISTQCEKYVLRKAFELLDLLPQAVLWRRKEAFSDGVSGEEKPWYQEIQERIPQNIPMNTIEKTYTCLNPMTPEARYYRTIYDTYYNCITIPYFWMPRWSEETSDPSARTLKIYS